MDKIKKILCGMTTIMIILSGTFVLGGCGPVDWRLRPEVFIYSECGTWVFRMHEERSTNENGHQIILSTSEDEIVLVGVVDIVGASDERGFLIIPTEIDGFMVVQLGDQPRHRVQERYFHEGGA